MDSAVDHNPTLPLALFFFCIAFLFWVIGWRTCPGEEKFLAYAYSVIFEFAGFAALTVWQVHSGQSLL